MVLQMLLSRFPGVLPDEQAYAKAAQGARKLGVLTADNRYVAELGKRELEETPYWRRWACFTDAIERIGKPLR